MSDLSKVLKASDWYSYQILVFVVVSSQLWEHNVPKGSWSLSLDSEMKTQGTPHTPHTPPLTYGQI